MFRKIMLCVFALFVAALLFGCKDQEKEQLKQDVANLRTSVADRQETILKMSTESLNRRDSLVACQHERDSLAGLLSAAQNKYASANANIRKQKATIDSLKVLADSLKCVEQSLAECSLELTSTQDQLVDYQSVNTSLVTELEAKAALLDSARQCYEVQKHNANRGWLSKVFASGKWSLPFPEPEFLIGGPATGESMLYQNVPNPFNQGTMISFSSPGGDYVMTVYNVTGQKVDEMSGSAEKGRTVMWWKAGMHPSGIYFYKVEFGTFSDTRKMVLMR